MGICSFKCAKGGTTGCCECTTNGTYEECIESKCSLNCLTETEEEVLESDWYYENYFKPQDEQGKQEEQE